MGWRDAMERRAGLVLLFDLRHLVFLVGADDGHFDVFVRQVLLRQSHSFGSCIVGSKLTVEASVVLESAAVSIDTISLKSLNFSLRVVRKHGARVTAVIVCHGSRGELAIFTASERFRGCRGGRRHVLILLARVHSGRDLLPVAHGGNQLRRASRLVSLDL